MSPPSPAALRRGVSRPLAVAAAALAFALLAPLAGCGGAADPPGEEIARESIETELRLGGCRLIVRADPREALVGDPITLLVIAEPAPGLVASIPQWPPASDEFEVSPLPPPLIAGLSPSAAVRSAELRCFEGGLRAIPPVTAAFEPRGGGAPFTLASEPLTLAIVSALGDDGDRGLADAEALRDLKAPLRLSDPAAWVWWLASVVATGAVLASLLMMLRRRREPPPPPPERVALDAIERLSVESAGGAADPRALWGGMASVLRGYLEGRLGVAATSQTGAELMAALVDAPLLSQRHRNEIGELLRQAELVLFAGSVPDRVLGERALLTLRRLVEETAAPAGEPR